MLLEPGPHVKRVKVNALPKVLGFLRVLLVSKAFQIIIVGVRELEIIIC
jgi:hypothetical protein